MGAVLEEGDAVAIAGALDRVRISELAVHVGDEAKLAVWVGAQFILGRSPRRQSVVGWKRWGW